MLALPAARLSSGVVTGCCGETAVRSLLPHGTAVLLYLFAASRNVWRIQLDSVLCTLALAALVNSFNSSSVNRTGTIFPLACPFGSLGRPIFLGFFCAMLLPVLSDDSGSDSRLRRNYGRHM